MLDLQGAPPLTGKDSASAQSIVPCADEFEYGEDLAVDCATGGSMRTAPSPSPPLLFALANTSKYVSGPVCRKSVSGIEGRQMLSESQMFRGIVSKCFKLRMLLPSVGSGKVLAPPTFHPIA